MRDNTRRRQRRSVYGLSAACILLFAALIQAEGMAIERGQIAAQGTFGAMLLREDAGGYVLVGVVCFAAAVVLVIACENQQAQQQYVRSGKRLYPRDRAEGRHTVNGSGDGKRRSHRQADAVLLLYHLWLRAQDSAGNLSTPQFALVMRRGTTYNVTVTFDGNGTGTASPATSEAGMEITLRTTPNTGYHFKTWQVVSGGLPLWSALLCASAFGLACAVFPRRKRRLG